MGGIAEDAALLSVSPACHPFPEVTIAPVTWLRELLRAPWQTPAPLPLQPANATR